MENELKKPTRSMSLGGVYRTEEINEIISKTQNYSYLLIFYIDYIRNYKELSEKDIKNIERFDDDSKMLLIKEYNKAIKAVNSLFE